MTSTLIRGGTLADGDGGAPRRADVRFADGVITEVAASLAPLPNEKVVDATGLLVTPGFVDVHTHYDGQATWDADLTPSCWHGITTIVMGNCGVGFAPVHPGQEQKLIELMEGVEDIPGTALHEGMTWGWESFPEYLDKLDQRQWTMDVGTHVPHAAVRAYVMGERAYTGDANAEELAQICEIVREGVVAGALGVSTTRMIAHRTSKGQIVPGTFAEEVEMAALANTLRDLGQGVFEVVPRGMDGEISEVAHAEIKWMGEVAKNSGRPLVFSLVQTLTEPDQWRVLADYSAELRAQGVKIHPQVGPRPVGIIFGLQSVQTPFSSRPSYKALEHLPLAERVAEMKKPEVRARILAEPNGQYRHPAAQELHEDFAHMFKVKAPIEWEPNQSETVAGFAAQAGVSAEEYCYDYLLEDGGRSMLLYPVTNYVRFNLKDVYDQLSHPATMFGLGDGGAHCGVACDAGNQTVLLSYWTRDRTRGPQIELAKAVRMITRDTAEIYGLLDRGRIAPGYRADINLIDFDKLNVEPAEMIYDLPAGAKRIVQRARGYVATFVNGVQTIANDQITGAHPGRLIRGPQNPQNLKSTAAA